MWSGGSGVTRAGKEHTGGREEAMKERQERFEKQLWRGERVGKTKKDAQRSGGRYEKIR